MKLSTDHGYKLRRGGEDPLLESQISINLFTSLYEHKVFLEIYWIILGYR